jgi:hypothetical protein
MKDGSMMDQLKMDRWLMKDGWMDWRSIIINNQLINTY